MTNLGPANSTVIKVLDKVTYPDASYTKFHYNGYIQVWKVENFAANNDLLNHVRTNLESPAADQTDSPKFTATWNKATNFNSGNEIKINNSLTTSQSFTLPGSLPNTSGTKIEVWMDGHPYDAVTKTIVGASGWQEGLTLATEEHADNIEGGTNARQRWTWNEWTQDDTGSADILNPRITETRVGDSTNTKRTEIDYKLYPSTTITEYGLITTIKVYDTDLSTVLKEQQTDYNLNTAYTDRRIIGLPAEVRSYGRETSGLNLMSKLTYAYDEGNFSDSGLNQNISPVQHDNTNYGSSFITGRANLTSTTRWNVEYPTTSGEAVTSSQKYNTAGAVVSKTDPLNRTVKVGYADNFNSSPGVSTWAYPTSVTDPADVSSTVKYRYDIGANVEANSPAPTGQTYGKTTKRIYDSIGRLERDSVYINTTEHAYTRYEFPTNGVQSKSYSTLVDTDSDGADVDDEVLSESWSDGAGRVRLSRVPHTFSGGSTSTWAGTVTEYDILGRVKRQSVPTEVDNSWAAAGDDYTRGFLWTYQKYDWMGRVVRKINTDGSDSPTLNDSDVLSSYAGCGCAGGLETTIEGELIPTVPSGSARRKQKTYSDILGRTVKTETFDWAGTVYSTAVNTFNGRDQVTQSRQYAGTTSGVHQDTTATFDGHGRLKSSHRPEQRDGSDTPTSTTYTYNTDDSISSVVDARGATTNYAYNNRGLVEDITWTVPGGSGIADPADVEFIYDNLGNRTSTTDGSGSTDYVYDSLSRMTSETKSFTGVTGEFTLAYTYQLSGKLKSITDPFEDVINYNDDKAARTTSVTGSTYAGVSTYATGIEFRAFGGLKEMTYANSGNPTVSYEYDNRLRVADYEAGSIRSAEYEYFADGKIMKVENILDPGLDQNYRFDHIGRLVGTVSGQKLDVQEEMEEPFTQGIYYDAFGNMTGRFNEIWGVEASFTASYTNGRITGGNEVYDNAGKLVDKTVTFNKYERWKFDAAGRNNETSMRHYQSIPTPTRDSTQTIAKTFDGDGLDVKRVDTDAWFSTFPTNTSGTIVKTEYYIRSTVLGGKIVTKLDDDAEKKVTLVHMGSGVLAEQRVLWSTPGVYWRHEDIVTGSYTKIAANGTIGGHADDSPVAVEYEPLGGAIPTNDPNPDPEWGFPPVGLLASKFSSDPARPQNSCIVDGILQEGPGPCTSHIRQGTGVPNEIHDQPYFMGYWRETHPDPETLPGGGFSSTQERRFHPHRSSTTDVQTGQISIEELQDNGLSNLYDNDCHQMVLLIRALLKRHEKDWTNSGFMASFHELFVESNNPHAKDDPKKIANYNNFKSRGFKKEFWDGDGPPKSFNQVRHFAGAFSNAYTGGLLALGAWNTLRVTQPLFHPSREQAMAAISERMAQVANKRETDESLGDINLNNVAIPMGVNYAFGAKELKDLPVDILDQICSKE